MPQPSPQIEFKAPQRLMQSLDGLFSPSSEAPIGRGERLCCYKVRRKNTLYRRADTRCMLSRRTQNAREVATALCYCCLTSSAQPSCTCAELRLANTVPRSQASAPLQLPIRLVRSSAVHCQAPATSRRTSSRAQIRRPPHARPSAHGPLGAPTDAHRAQESSPVRPRFAALRLRPLRSAC